MSIANNIALLRKEAGLTQEQLAEKCDVSRQAVTKWEAGISEPSIDKLVNLAEVFQVTIDELINGNKNDKSGQSGIDIEKIRFVKEYGHDSYMIAPMREKMAHKLYDTGLRVYNLIPGGTAERTVSHQDIVEHAEKGGYFAIEKAQWLMFVEKKSLEKVEELLEDDYNMVDGIINNGDRTKENGCEKKTSVMEKLQEKKMEVNKTVLKKEKKQEIELN